MKKPGQPDVDQNSMIDTQVLIYGCRGPRKTDGPEDRDMCAASQSLLERLRTVRVSAMTWVEFLRLLKPDEQKRFAHIKRKMQIEAVDGPIAERAAVLLNALQVAPISLVPCPHCRANIPKHKRVADAIIAATAESVGCGLYTYDSRIKEWSDLVGPTRLTCPLLVPPHPDGEIFENPKSRKRRAELSRPGASDRT